MERSIARFLAVCLGPPLLLGLLPVEALLTALLPEPLFAVRPDLGGGGPADLLGCVPGGTGAGASAAGGLEFPWSAMIFSCCELGYCFVSESLVVCPVILSGEKEVSIM